MIVAGRYEILGPIGSGGEARVYRARDPATGREVALRLNGQQGEILQSPIPSPPDPTWVRMFERGLDPEHGAYATFELLQGETLAAQVARAPLAWEALRTFVHQAMQAVGALHDAGWVHGDLNAENFFWHEDQTWKLLELPFHRLPSPATSPLFGSIYTLAPEQFDGQRPDARSDLFSLGCLFYYAASGVYPHSGGSEAGIAIARLRFSATPLAELAPTLPAAFAPLVMRLLARDPATRPEGISAARALLNSLDEPRPPAS